MEKRNDLTLVDVGDTIFRVLMHGLNSRGVDSEIEISCSSSPLQESLFLNLPDESHVLVKIFPHKNFLQHDVFRIEVYKTRPGDMRGNRVAFVETTRAVDAIEEVRRFTEGIFPQLGPASS